MCCHHLLYFCLNVTILYERACLEAYKSNELNRACSTDNIMNVYHDMKVKE